MMHRPKMINERFLLRVHKRTQFCLTAHVCQTSSGFISSSSYPEALGIQLGRNHLNFILGAMGGKQVPLFRDGSVCIPMQVSGPGVLWLLFALSGEGFVLRARAGGGARLSSGLLKEGRCA